MKAGIRTLVIGLALALLSGCSAMRLAYTNADTYLVWQADRYFDLTTAQRSELRRIVTRLMDWHRAEQLPKYAQLADQAAARVTRGLTQEDLDWIWGGVNEALRDTLVAAAREAAPLVDQLTPEQIAHLESRLARENRDFAKEFLERKPEERRERRLKRASEQVEDWIGDLSDAQEARVKRYSEALPLTDEMRDARRKRAQGEFVAIARGKEAARRLAGWAEHLFPGGAYVGFEPAHAAALRRGQAEYQRMLLDLDRGLTPAQRRHAVERLKALADDFRQLSTPLSRPSK